MIGALLFIFINLVTVSYMSFEPANTAWPNLETGRVIYRSVLAVSCSDYHLVIVFLFVDTR